ncbi:MAG: ATP-binding protein [Anaerolineales bacterium]|nr:ATP-binding protein [Anaerolineales bacterium]
MGYIVGHPIKHPKDFYGRFQEVARFYEIVAGDQAQSVNILGLRRSGKTSFLQYIAHPEVMTRYLPDAQRYVIIYQDISICKNTADFYHRILSQLQRILKSRQPSHSWSLPEAGQAAIHDIETFLPQFPEYRFILLLDEFDRLRTGQFDQNFLAELRALTIHWEYELACVTASFWDIYQLGEYVSLQPTSPFYNIFYPSPIILHGLEAAEIEQLIQTPAAEENLPFSPKELATIYRLAGSLPFFIQATAADSLRRKKQGESLSSAKAIRQLTANLSTYFKQWWQQFSLLEQEILCNVAQFNHTKNLTFNQDDIEVTKTRFINFGLIRKVEDTLTINGDIFTLWLNRKNSENKKTNHQTTVKNSPYDKVLLKQKINTHFNKEEVDEICFDLNVDKGQLRTSRKAELVIDLIDYLERRRSLPALVTACQERRPHVDW